MGQSNVQEFYSIPLAFEVIRLFSLISTAHTLQVIYLCLTHVWTFELLAMACNRGFNM